MDLNLDKFAKGALKELLNAELQKAINNIGDPNTSPTSTRKVSVTISLKPTSDQRNFTMVSLSAKTTLAPVKPVETSFVIDIDTDTGKVVAAEYNNQIAGQTEIEIPEEMPQGDNIVDLRSKNAN